MKKNVHTKQFDNGLTLVTAPSSGTKAITLLILTGAGSRFETEAERGTAHFLEHMFFKGGEKFQTAQEVSQAIDQIGGDFNAFTGKEYAGYYVKVLAEKKEVAFDVLSDMLLKSKFDQKEIDKEKGVIIEELNMYEDMPVYKVGWDFEELMFPNHPMGLDQIGLPEVINNMTTADFKKYQNDLYTPENTVVIVSGNISPEESETLTEQYFPFAEKKKEREAKKFNWKPTQPVFIRNKNTEQAHLVIGYPGYNRNNENRYAESILSILLGGNMSSRMFLKIREERGLCYSISCSTDRYTDCGTFSTRAGVALNRVEEAIEAITAEYERVKTSPPTEEEVQMAKNYLKGKISMRMEDSEEIASFFGSQMLLQRESQTLEEYFEKIDAVTPQDVLNVAHELFDTSKRSMSIIGPFEEKKEIFEQLVRG
jgi:predicted Zn-dependent peptidase